MPATAETIHEFFKEYGWQYDHDEESATWRTGFRGDSNNFNIVVHLTEHWVYMAISPYVNAAQDEQCGARLHQHLLRLNHAINLAKFGIDLDGDVVLTVELPTENLDYSEFADGMNALSFYADGHYLDILNLAHNPAYEPAEVEEEPDGAEPEGGSDGGSKWQAN